MRYFLHLSYQGGRYRGYQRQPGVVSVQETIETVLQEVFRQPLALGGCGRTDAEVHASQYFAAIDLATAPRPDQLLILNRRLPADISLHEIVAVDPSANARFDATRRTYDYFLHLDKNAGLQGISSWVPAPDLDVEAMRSVTDRLPHYQDYRAYCKTPDRHNTTLCRLEAVRIYRDATGRHYRFQFVGNRYLRGMIRLLVGNLLRVGQGQNTPADFLQKLEDRTSPTFHHLAPPEGLYLSGVTYPYLERANASPLQRMLAGLTDPE